MWGTAGLTMLAGMLGAGLWCSAAGHAVLMMKTCSIVDPVPVLFAAAIVGLIGVLPLLLISVLGIVK